MKVNLGFWGISVRFTFLFLLLIGSSLARSQSVPFAVGFWYPTNSQSFAAPATVGIHALVTDSNVVRTMQYFSGSTSIGIVTNTGNVPFTNSTQSNPFFLSWSNVSAGSYTLKAVATDSAGNMATSAPVMINVTNPVIHPSVYIYSPTNGAKFLAPANVNIYARAVESGGTVATVHFFANSTSLGVVSNSSQVIVSNISSAPLFPLTWSNVSVGSYALKAVATDTSGNSSTSPVVNIYVVTNIPPPVVHPSVAIYSPTNGTTYHAPTNVNIYARAVENPGMVATVQFFANSVSLGVVSNSSQVIVSNISSAPVFPLTWSNAPVGSYALKAIATDTNGNTATSSVVNIYIVTNSPPPNVPFAISLWYPTNGQSFLAPANIYLHARVTDSNAVQTVQYFSGTTSIGIVSNTSGVLLTNSTQGNPFYLLWSNVPAGSYSLTAVALDSAGNTATSAPVNISVTNSPPPPNIPFVVSFVYPTNGQTFLAPAKIYLHARVTDSNVVQTVQYFSGTTSLGIVSNTSGVLLTNSIQGNPFYLLWSNVPAGNYSLTAVALDSAGNTATSAPVNITVTNIPPPNVPFVVSFAYPTNGQTFLAPANIYLHARVTDSNVVQTVQYFSGTTSIGIVSNTSGALLTNSTQGNPFYLLWSNVPAGSYSLSAVALDSAGNMATSAPVNIYVVTNLPPVVSIYAPDPVAIEGTNYYNWFKPGTSITNYISGTNTATFLVRRDSSTNTDLTVYYSIGGTAINGVDYETISGSVTIAAGQRYALITIVPLDDTDSSYRYYDTVVLSLLAPPTAFNSPMTYSLGSPRRAGAIILEENFLPIPNPVIRTLADNSLHVSLPATNGMNFCLQVSTDMVNWQPVCTNTVLKGSAQYVDPGAGANTGLFYRIAPVDAPASY